MPTVKNVSRVLLAFDLDTWGANGSKEELMLSPNERTDLSEDQMKSKRIQKAIAKNCLRIVRDATPKKVVKKAKPSEKKE